MKKNYSKHVFLFLSAISLSFTAAAQIIADGTYQITNTVHSEAMTIDTTAPYEAKMGATDATDDFQLWTFTHQGGDVYKIMNNGSDTTLGINDGWCGNFGDVRANFSDTDANVEFKVVNGATANNYLIEIAFTTCNFGSINDPIKAFDIQDGNAGAQIQTFEKDISSANQQFQIVVPVVLSIDTQNTLDDLEIFYAQNKGLIINAKQNLKLEVFNMSGAMVVAKELDNSLESAIIGLGTIKTGLYMANITNSNGQNKVVKFVVN